MKDFDRAKGAAGGAAEAPMTAKLTGRRASARGKDLVAAALKRPNFNEIRAKMKAEKLRATPTYDLAKRQEFAESLKSEIQNIKRAQRELEMQSKRGVRKGIC